MIAHKLPVVTQDNDYDEAPGFDRMGYRNLDVEGGYGSPYATEHRQRDFLQCSMSVVVAGLHDRRVEG